MSVLKILKNSVFNTTTFSKDITIEEGDVVHVFGDINSGKTTLLNLFYNLLTGRYENENYSVNKVYSDSEVVFIPVHNNIDELNVANLLDKKVIIFESLVNTLPVNLLKATAENGITVIFSTGLIGFKFKNVKEIKLVK